MGYPLPNSSPQCVVNGRTIAVAAFRWDNIAGSFYVAGVYEMVGTGWNQISSLTYNTSDLIGLMQQKGGSVKFRQWVITELNRMLVDLFGAPQPPEPNEPTTNDEADAWMVSSFAQLKLTVINGTPVLG